METNGGTGWERPSFSSRRRCASRPIVRPQPWQNCPWSNGETWNVQSAWEHRISTRRPKLPTPRNHKYASAGNVRLEQHCHLVKMLHCCHQWLNIATKNIGPFGMMFILHRRKNYACRTGKVQSWKVTNQSGLGYQINFVWGYWCKNVPMVNLDKYYRDEFCTHPLKRQLNVSGEVLNAMHLLTR